MPHLILIAVGPVQTFIASARKLRDLWFGSDLLSELSKGVAHALSTGAELVFPHAASAELQSNSTLLVANKILALTHEDADPKELVQRAREAYDAFFRQQFDLTERSLGADFTACVDGSMFRAQLPDVGEFFAVWVPCSPEKYAESRAAAEQLMASRKAYRTFSQPLWASGEGRRKSSLDGARESVLLSERRSKARLIRRALVKQGEELDAIALVKRCAVRKGHRRLRFESLTSLALEPYIEGLRATGLEPRLHALQERAWQNEVLRSLLKGGQEAGECCDFLHAEWGLSVLDDLRAERLAIENEPDLAAETHKTLARINDDVNQLHRETTQPGKYAAILHGDGDHMGKAINELVTPKEHQAFSAKLSGFASGVREIVEERCSGCLVYSGGDDVLALLPLHTALECAAEIAASFSQAMAGISSKTRPTFSAGLAIVHHRDALSDSLDLARAAEKQAKNRFGRNALAITVAKRGGDAWTLGGKWEVLPGWLQELATYHREGAISSKLAYDLKRALDRAPKPWSWDTETTPPLPKSVKAAEALNVVRQKEETSESAVAGPAAERLVANLAHRTDPEQLPLELIVATELGRAKALAQGRWK